MSLKESKLWLIIGYTFKSFFMNSFGWIILIVLQFVLAFQYLSLIETYLQYQQQVTVESQLSGVSEWVIKPFFASLTVIILFIVPLMFMRIFAIEQKNHIRSLLMSAPIAIHVVILGKWLGVMLYQLLMIVIMSLMPLALVFFTSIDFGLFLSALMGMILLAFFCSALSIYFMVLFKHASIAVFSVYSVLLFFWLMNWQINKADMESLTHLSVFHHIQPFLSGYFSTANLAFFLLTSIFFIFLAIIKKQQEIWPK